MPATQVTATQVSLGKFSVNAAHSAIMLALCAA